jgi:fido (protein-threonine AMPylation protein)
MQIQIFAPAGLANKRYKMKGGRSFCVCTVIESTITQLYKHYKQQQQKGMTAVATSTATTKAAI